MYDAKTRTWNGTPIAHLESPALDDFLDYRHDCAKKHPLNVAAEARAEAAVDYDIAYHRALGKALRAAAERLIEQAYEADRKTERWYGENADRLREIERPIEDAGYWAARAAIDMG